MSSVVTFPRSGPGARILVVDDEEPIRRSLVRLLERAGYECATAEDAPEARRLLGAETFDLMLCDVTMPGESGFKLLAHAHQVDPDLAVIMITARACCPLWRVRLRAQAVRHQYDPHQRGRCVAPEV
jgi:putative two-component system response regulator